MNYANLTNLVCFYFSVGGLSLAWTTNWLYFVICSLISFFFAWESREIIIQIFRAFLWGIIKFSLIRFFRGFLNNYLNLNLWKVTPNHVNHYL
jgi:hypothetical protein